MVEDASVMAPFGALYFLCGAPPSTLKLKVVYPLASARKWRRARGRPKLKLLNRALFGASPLNVEVLALLLSMCWEVRLLETPWSLGLVLIVRSVGCFMLLRGGPCGVGVLSRLPAAYRLDSSLSLLPQGAPGKS